ncbi:MAG: helix-turn-helix transcriptional regulator [Phycisphaerae bacterium]|nr:helix-turn-helix transcriptional regulator [Phycisphaerae bacterium]
MRIETELMRGAGPVAVLKVLERKEMYGYELVEALSARSDGLLAMGQSTLYPLLYNLEAKSLITSRWDETEARPRKYYRITDAGKKKLAEATKQWRDVTKAMTSLGILNASALAGG